VFRQATCGVSIPRIGDVIGESLFNSLHEMDNYWWLSATS